MPIKHLQTNRPAQFPMIGKLRKGSAKRKIDRNGREIEILGKDLKYFRFVTDDPAAAAAFSAYYGAEPASVQVYLPYATAAENFAAWLEEYTASGLIRRCDGETCVFHRNTEGKADTTPIPCAKDNRKPCNCKQVGRLAVIVPQLARLAWIMVETHSTYDIIQLTENLQAAEVMRGDLRGIPFILSRRDREISYVDDKGALHRITKSLLFIEPDPEWVQRQIESMRIAALPLVDLPALQAPAPRMIAGPIGSPAGFEDDDPDDDDPPPTTTNGKPLATEAQINELEEAGQEYYKDAWTKKRGELCNVASTGSATEPAQLTQTEIQTLIAGIKERLAGKPAQTNGSK